MLPASEYDDTCPFDRISANNERAGGKEVPVPSECVIYGGQVNISLYHPSPECMYLNGKSEEALRKEHREIHDDGSKISCGVPQSPSGNLREVYFFLPGMVK